MCEVELYPDRAYMCSNWRIATCTVQEHAIVYSQFLDCAYQTGIWLYMNCFFIFSLMGTGDLPFSHGVCVWQVAGQLTTQSGHVDYGFHFVDPAWLSNVFEHPDGFKLFLI